MRLTELLRRHEVRGKVARREALMALHRLGQIQNKITIDKYNYV